MMIPPCAVISPVRAAGRPPIKTEDEPFLQRVSQKIDSRDILLIGHENSHEFRHPHVVTEQWPHLILEDEARTDLGCAGDCYVDEPMLIHSSLSPFNWSLRYLFNVS